MKGIMVPLLVICMTGMVIGQQPQNNSDQFGNQNRSPAQSRSVMEDSSTNSSRNPASVNQLGPLELVLNDQLIADFRSKGQLSAPIEPQQFVNEIVLMHDSVATAKTATGSMIPVAKQGDVLRFELDDYDLESLKQQGLRYSFDQFERGRYSQVQFDYRSSGARSGGLGSGSAVNSTAFGERMSGQQSAYLPPPSPDYSRPYDPNFMGPTLSNLSNTTTGDSFANPSNRQTSWGPQPNSGNQLSNQFDNSPTVFPANRRNDLAGSSSGNNSFNSNTPATYQPQRQFNNSFGQANNQLASSGNYGYGNPPGSSGNVGGPTAAELRQQQIERKKAEALQQRIQLEQQELAEIEETNRLKEQAIRDQQRQRLALQQQTLNNRQSGPSFGTIDPNDAYNQFSPRQNNDRFASLTGSEYADRVVNGYSPPPARTPNQLTPASETNEGVRSYVGSIPGPQSANDGPDRLAANPFNQKNVAGNINKQDAPEAGILYFMLLFSLGLNVYLGWIARGFYVRYNELADELRETFTATM